MGRDQAAVAHMGTMEVTGHEQAATARAAVRSALAGHPDELVDTAELVAAELVANALLHGGGWAEVSVVPCDGGARIEVADRCRNPPLIGLTSDDAMTGRGLRLVRALAAGWGVDSRDGGKVVWAEVSEHGPQDVAADEEDVLAAWPDWDEARGARHRVTLGEVPTDLLISAKAHVDNLVREFTLAASGAVSGLTARIPPHLAQLVEGVVHDFAEARLAIKRQAVEAARAGRSHTLLELELSPEAAEAGERYLEALDEADAYCRAMRLLTLETPPQHRVFRRWYVGELVAQLRAAAAGLPSEPPETFEQRLLRELDVVTHVGRGAARLYSVAGALAVAATPEAVAEAVLKEAVAALGASGGGVLTATGAAADRLALPGAVGYPAHVVEGLRHESRDAELPAALALRTGETVWLESRDEIEARFPELVGNEPETAALCAVPLATQGRVLGALRFSFKRPRLFDEDERRFVLALAALTAQALDRAQLLQDRVDVSQRLQHSLLPPRLPDIPGLEVAAVYDPLGDGVDVGGDFYDVWKLSDHQWAVAVGDVTGNGPEAAAVTALARYTLRALTMVETSLETTLLNLNAAMLTNALPMGDGERFCTLILARVTVGEGIRVELASGGHPYPILRGGDGTIEEIRLEGSLLGAIPGPKVGFAELSLDPGDLLVLYTDGVSEARDGGGFFEVEGVLRVLGGCGGTAFEAAETLERAVLAHTGGVLTDDMAIVALRVPDEGGARGAV